MKKVILAKLSKEDSDLLQKHDANVYTFNTLQLNQFFDSTEKKKIRVKMEQLMLEREKVYKDVLKKYKVPYVINGDYHIDPDRSELYTNIYNK